MKAFKILAMSLLISGKLFAQVDQDGPYIWRLGDRVISRYVLDDAVKVDTLKESKAIRVQFTAHKDWNYRGLRTKRYCRNAN